LLQKGTRLSLTAVVPRFTGSSQEYHYLLTVMRYVERNALRAK
jgi:hypothetical protein